jgi:prepilin-type N-terminal cleavage/methylation domain-containing protein
MHSLSVRQHDVCRKNRLPRERQGFTLIELMLVVGLLLVLAVVALPGIAGWQSRLPLDRGMSELQTVCQKARIGAIETGVTHVLELTASGTEGAVLAPANAAQTPDLFEFHLGPQITSLLVQDMNETQMTRLYFYPSGNSSSAQLLLTDTDGNRAKMFLDRLTGMLIGEHTLNRTTGLEQ